MENGRESSSLIVEDYNRNFIPVQPKLSTMKEKPVPDVDIAALTTVKAAPTAIQMAAISSSVYTTTTPVSGCSSKNTLSSEAGVMG